MSDTALYTEELLLQVIARLNDLINHIHAGIPITTMPEMGQPAPVVHVAAPEAPVVHVPVDELASAIRMAQLPPPDISPYLAELGRKFDELANQLRTRPAEIRALGGGVVRLDPGTTVNAVLEGGATENTLVEVRDHLAPLSSRFARLLKFEPAEGEEIRRDETLSDDYHGAAVDGTPENAAAWDVARFYKTAGLITRVRFRPSIRWDLRAEGW